eukprot:SAG31_NODE_7947_length_1557_cov_0.923868_1_plen_221_part_00
MPKYTLLNCSLEADVLVDVGTTIEYSTVHEGTKIGKQCLISGAEIPAGAVIGDNTFLQTWAQEPPQPCPVSGNAPSYVCHILSTKDDIKLDSAKQTNGTQNVCKWFGTPMEECCAKLGIEYAIVWTNEEKAKNLWEAKVFPIAPTISEATKRALAFVKKIKGEHVDGWNQDWVHNVTSLDVSLKDSNAGTHGKLRMQLAKNILQAGGEPEAEDEPAAEES